jgi:hypothetical protein
MKDKTAAKILIIVIGATILIFLFTIVYRKMTHEIFIQKIAAYIKRMEGGLGRGQEDNAAKYPAPWAYQGKTGWHTNKGVTYAVFEANGKKLGYEVNAKNFFEMPDVIWWKIFNNVFLAQWNLSKIDHLPRIQAVIISWAWNSGNAGAEKYLARFQRDYFKVQDSNITKLEIIDNFNKYVKAKDEVKVFLALCDRRKEDYSQMSEF